MNDNQIKNLSLVKELRRISWVRGFALGGIFGAIIPSIIAHLATK